MKQNIRITLLVIAIFFGSLSSYAQSSGFEVVKSIEILDQIYENLEKYYVDDIEPGNLSKIAIDAMLKELDPYTVYYHEANIEDYQLMTTGQYGGIGALIRRIDDHVYIAEPYEGKPASVAGLKAGDLIVEIDGKSMLDKSSEEVSNSLKGPKGTEVEVVVKRNEGQEVKVKFTRDEIKLPDVPYYGMMKGSTGYIKLNSFTKTASSEVIKAYNELKSQGMEELILDLRGNGGGLLIEAVKITNMFINKDETVVTTKGRVLEENRTYTTMTEPIDLVIPVAVLINSTSASASEIVSGTLQDLDRAVIVGTTSFGKGLVQRTYDLDYGSKIKLTIAKYYTPSGRCVQKLEYYDKMDGERPQEIPDSLIKIFKTRNGREVIDGRGIEPDIAIEQDELSRLTATLFTENLIFHFATKYYYSHPSIDSAGDFHLSDDDYNEFKKFVLDHDFTYSTESEEMLKKVKKTLEEEEFMTDADKEYEALLQKVVPSKERDLVKFQDEIKELLENEIVSRYYYQRGRAQHSFNYDKDVHRAIEVLNNSSEYNTILKK